MRYDAQHYDTIHNTMHVTTPPPTDVVTHVSAQRSPMPTTYATGALRCLPGVTTRVSTPLDTDDTRCHHSFDTHDTRRHHSCAIGVTFSRHSVITDVAVWPLRISRAEHTTRKSEMGYDAKQQTRKFRSSLLHRRDAVAPTTAQPQPIKFSTSLQSETRPRSLPYTSTSRHRVVVGSVGSDWSPEPRTAESSMPNLRINNTRSAPAILRRLRLCGCVCRVGCDGGGGDDIDDGGAAEANVKRCVASCRREAVKRKRGGRGAARRWRRGDAMVAERR